MSDTMRDAFEAHFKSLDLSTEQDSWGMPQYKHSRVDALWIGWQAAQSQPSPPVPATAQEIMRMMGAYIRTQVLFDRSPLVELAPFNEDCESALKPLYAALTALVDERDRLKFELAGVNAMRRPEWQTIETAPKDGTHVLIANNTPGSVHPREAYYILPEHRYESEPPEPGWWRLAGSSEECVRGRTPSHWQPMPPSPTHGIEPEQGESHD